MLFGDFAQLPPVGDKPLFACPSSGGLKKHGHTIYRLFTKVIILSQAHHQVGSDPAALSFRSFLLRLRDGNVSHSDREMLLEHLRRKLTTQMSSLIPYDRQSVAEYNLRKLYSLQSPVARINAIHSDSGASSASPDDAGGL